MRDRHTTPREIAELNIAHYARLLQTPLDGPTRATVERLLAEEKARLSTLPPAGPAK